MLQKNLLIDLLLLLLFKIFLQVGCFPGAYFKLHQAVLIIWVSFYNSLSLLLKNLNISEHPVRSPLPVPVVCLQH